MRAETLASPAALLAEWRGGDALSAELSGYEHWWRDTGLPISAAVDRAGTPALRMFDRCGWREDAVLYPPEYRSMLLHGYATGIIVSGDGLILTAAGAYLADGYAKVVLENGEEYKGTVERRSDALQAAVLRIEAATPRHFELPEKPVVL